ncbi:MAG: endonuclease/exonuclease/phosphatase family protein [Dysgonamonadaceae bacterium]|jgi:endonuclease/exonuclease/phosphatase family metal-dependent hydrolase|nr:endonuclease/exonuclease/phosphatase family protein [Dysgonamonadaceae bacterium]
MKLKSFFGGIVSIINAVALGILLLSAFSDYVSPLRFLPAAYLGLFFPFILLGNLLFFIFLIIIRKWKQVLLSLAVFLICSSSIFTYFPIHFKKEEPPKTAIKLLTYNVMHFEWMTKNKVTNKNDLLEYISKSDADIICLQEYGVYTNNNATHLTENEVKTALKKLPYYEFIQIYGFPGGKLGMAIFSKYPILSVERINYTSTYNGSFAVEINVRGKRLTLINNHLESNKLTGEDKDDYLKITKDIDSQTLDVLKKILYYRLGPAYKIRAKQAQLISDYIAKNKNKYIVVCGDFNDTPISYSRHKVKGKLKDAFVETGNGAGITYNKNRFLFRIDYILHSDNIKAYKAGVGNLRSSDHYPLWCYLDMQ